MSTRIQAIRGMHDILPATTACWQWAEDCARAVLQAHGFEQIRIPLVEHTALFSRSIGEVTDIVEKEMYTFEDRNGESLSLRPEGTAGCVRAAIESGLLRGPARKLWYQGAMFRHERPQKGRYRQFHQIGVECLGLTGPEVDVELVLLGARLWRSLGLSGLRLELNSLGDTQTRATHRTQLVDYFQSHRNALDEDSLRRLETNPLRILDSKNPNMLALIENAPTLTDFLDDASAEHFQTLRALLDAAGVEYVVNPRLVRGLDYYSRTVFEWVSDELGAQGTVCAGGRYDYLVERLGGPATPAVGFALGLERLVALLEQSDASPRAAPPHACLLTLGAEAAHFAYPLAETLRDRLPQLRLLMDGESGSLKSKLRRADRSGAGAALIVGEQEAVAGQVNIKYLRDPRAQETIDASELHDHLVNLISSTDADDDNAPTPTNT